MIPAAMHNGLSLLPRSPLAGGLLTGKYTRGTFPAADTRAGSDNPLYQWATNRYMTTDQSWPTIDTVTRIATDIGATPTQVALAWTADQPAVVAPIVGARTVHQITDSLGAADLHLDADALNSLDNVSRPQPATYPYGAFGTNQRARQLDGSDDLADLVANRQRRIPRRHPGLRTSARESARISHPKTQRTDSREAAKWRKSAGSLQDVVALVTIALPKTRCSSSRMVDPNRQYCRRGGCGAPWTWSSYSAGSQSTATRACFLVTARGPTD